MRERLDCAVMMTHCTVDWIAPYLGPHAGGRLYMHALDAAVDIGSEEAPAVLRNAALVLRRYDACVLPVCPATLSWARTSMSQATPGLRTPIMALVRELTTAGLYDLYELGVADFLRDPFCSHEARMRIERLLDGQRVPSAALAADNRYVSDSVLNGASYMDDPVLEQMCRNILAHDGPELEAYAIAAASRCATSSESFRDAKRKVIERFERAYITAALGRHGGNIAMAARAAQKHRRAFWALMRKHDIDAEPFRMGAATVLQAVRPASPGAAGLPVRAPCPAGSVGHSESAGNGPGPISGGEG